MDADRAAGRRRCCSPGSPRRSRRRSSLATSRRSSARCCCSPRAARRARASSGWSRSCCRWCSSANLSSYTPQYKSDMRDVGGEMAPLLHQGDLVVVGQPEQTPLADYYLPAGLRFATTIGPVNDPSYMNWVYALRGCATRSPQATLPPLLASLKRGQQLLFVRPLTEGAQNWKASWTVAGATALGPVGRDLPGRRRQRDAEAGRRRSAQLPRRVLRRRQRRALPEGFLSTRYDRTPPAPPGSEITPEHPVVVLGGGPAGLTAGYLLAKQGKPVIVLESTDMVGGIARTEVRDGYRFDLGGHRFFTKVKEVDDLWHEIMKEEFLKRPRQSRIYWNDKFLEYPLEGMDVISKLGPIELVALRPLLPVGGDQAQGPRGELRAVGLQPLRQAALQPLLQDLHREAVGRLRRRHPRRVGRAADQGPVVLQCRQGGVLRQQGQQDQVADLEVQLPALRPRPDVGADDRDIHEHGGEVRLNAPVTRLRSPTGASPR